MYYFIHYHVLSGTREKKRERGRERRRRGGNRDTHFSLLDVIDPSFPEMFPLCISRLVPKLNKWLKRRILCVSIKP